MPATLVNKVVDKDDQKKEAQGGEKRLWGVADTRIII
jgi:hypothetical protein